MLVVIFSAPFKIKIRRSFVKRYGCVFTCLYSRAVHIEVCTDLSSDSFILALRRFISIRGPVSCIRCDQGTNFVGASNELKSSLEKMDEGPIKSFLLSQNCQIKFIFNPPNASHFGGVFERQIGSIRKVLSGLLLEHGSALTEECLITLLCEVAAILNCRPLSHINLSDSTVEPLTPNHLLTQKSQVVVSPPGTFVREDLYLHKRWKRVQYIANIFWTRWKHEYLNTLNKRQKWTSERRNICVNDIVLLCDENAARSEWKIARVVEVFVSRDNLVRSVRLQMGTSNLDSKGKRMSEPCFLTRPVHKLVLLLEA